jgi:hypothetical protein
MEPRIHTHFIIRVFLKKFGKAKKDGIKKMPTIKNPKLKKKKAIKLDCPECATVLPISLKKFKKKE